MKKTLPDRKRSGIVMPYANFKSDYLQNACYAGLFKSIKKPTKMGLQKADNISPNGTINT